ncbi:MAG: phage major capsid protein [Patescibacteria group bacterium]|nr:phage major capsid protein [Patescibacteria group bacterium]
MPWKIEKKDDKFEVVEESGGKHPGKVFGTHATKAEADAQLKALYANTKDEKSTPVEMARTDGVTNYRYFRANKDNFSDENTFEVRMSSEFPAEQRAKKEHERLGIAKEGEKYVEVLSHNEGDVDLSRFTGENRAALLDEHQDNRHLGYIKTAALSDDKATRGVVVFDNLTKLSKTRCKQVRSGSRPNFSIGYRHTKYLGPVPLEDGRIGHRFAWEGLELSNTSVPADPTAQEGRSKNRECHCIRCGDIFGRSELDDNFMCPDCADAETPAEDSERGNSERMFRAKTSEGETMISHNDLRNKVAVALDNDKRFKSKSDNGNVRSDFQVHDIHQIVGDGDDDDYQAIVSSPAWSGTYHAVDFTYDGKDVTLGDATEVEPKTTFEAVDRGLTHDGRLIRKDDKKPYGNVKYADPGYQKDGKARYPIDTKEHAKAAWDYINKTKNADKYSPENLAKVKSKIKAACKKFGVDTSDERTEAVPETRTAVDLEKIAEAEKSARNNLQNPIMAKSVAELKTEAPELVAQIETETRAAAEKSTRAAVISEFDGKSGKRAALVKEIRALANDFVKEKGSNFYGKPGEVTTVGERIRSFEQEALQSAFSDESRSDSEIRSDFKNRSNDVIRDSKPAKNPMEAANLDKSVANRCSLGRIMREGIKAADKNQRSSCFILTDGAEAEANTELRKIADEFPGGAASLPEGMQLPWNMPSGVRSNTRVERLGRDSLAGDFATAGALIAPQYEFPTIELLRNFPALSRAGMTVLSGLLGSPIVLPRQESPTTAQSLAEGGALVQYDQVLGQIKLSAHRVGSSQKYSRLALLQTTPDFEAMVMADHMAVIALKIDALGLNGQGAGDEPLGVLNQLIQSVAFAGSAANAFKNAVAMETAIRKANVPDEISYITTSASRGMLKTVAKLLIGATTVAAEPVWGDDDEVNGRPAWDSQQVPGDVILAGAFKHLVMAQWGGLAVVLDTISQANQDKYWLNINTYIDFALRHNQAFCRSSDSLAALS